MTRRLRTVRVGTALRQYAALLVDDHGEAAKHDEATGHTEAAKHDEATERERSCPPVGAAG